MMLYVGSSVDEDLKDWLGFQTTLLLGGYPPYSHLCVTVFRISLLVLGSYMQYTDDCLSCQT